MDEDLMKNLCLNLVLLGRTGVGKSSSGNTILGREAFVSESSSTSVEHNVAVEIGNICGFPIKVYDTPGLSDTELSKEDLWKYEEILQKCESGLCAFLLVLRADIFTEEDQEALEKIEELLGAKRIQNTWILFTRGDELEEENKTINKVIKETEYLKNLVQKYEGRHHVLNNKHIRKHDDQVDSLISKVFYRNLENLPKRQRTSVNNAKSPVNHNLTRRIVLLGKSGVGKSAAANTILGQREFESTVGSISVTRESSVKHATVSGRKVSVVDTPGLFDTHMSSEQLMIEIARSVYISSPGPHAFLIVFPVNRFTQQEEEIPQIIEMLFGEEVLKYSIILFTHGDQLEGRSIEEIIEENGALSHLVGQCGGRYHVFNNRDKRNREQVNDLLQKIDTMIEQNGGGHYSNEMFEDALRFRRDEEIDRLKQETGERIRAEIQHENNLRQEQEENQRQEEIERLRKQTEQKIRAEIQCENNVRKQQEEIQRQEEIERVRRQTEERIKAECKVQMMSEMERLKEERQREEEERKQQEEKQRQEEIERVRRQTEERIKAECKAQMMSEMEKLKEERQREEEERKQQEEKQRQEEIERVRRQTEERIKAECKAQMMSEMERLKEERQREEEERKQQEEKQRQEEIERVRRQTEERIKAECKAQMMSEMERLKEERQREEEERKQQEEKQRQEETERVRRQTEERVRAEIKPENNDRQREENQNTPECDERSGFKKFFSKYWKHFLMGIAAGAIIGEVVVRVVGGIVSGVVALIVGKRQGRH